MGRIWGFASEGTVWEGYQEQFGNGVGKAYRAWISCCRQSHHVADKLFALFVQSTDSFTLTLISLPAMQCKAA